MTADNRTLAARLLDQAATIVNGDRRRQKRAARTDAECHRRFLGRVSQAQVGSMINGHRHPIDAVDASNMMELLKLVV